MKITIEELRRKLGTIQQNMLDASEDYRRNKSLLYTTAGGKSDVPKYGEQEHARRLADIDSELRRAHREAQEAINEATAEVERAQVLGTSPVPFAVLGSESVRNFLKQTEALTRDFKTSEVLAIRRDFIREDAADLPLGELASAIEAAALRGSTIEQGLYSRYASRRLQRETPDFVPGEPLPSGPAGLQALHDALDKLPARATVDAGALQSEIWSTASNVSALFQTTIAGRTPSTDAVDAYVATEGYGQPARIAR